MALSLLILLASPLAVSGLSLTPVVGGTVGAGYAKTLAGGIGGVVTPNLAPVATAANAAASVAGAGLQAVAGVHSALDSAVVNMACDIVNATLHSGNGAIRDVINAVIGGTSGLSAALAALNLGSYPFGANYNATAALQIAAQKVVQDAVTGNVLGLVADTQDMIAASVAALFSLAGGVTTPLGSVSGGSGLGAALDGLASGAGLGGLGIVI
ncbi:hypothetical protein PRIPAC_82245 [Pristionchus pacificus]|uniref:Uncharacterized protein n=1 Tax=Pristionchus pacificus TaxID=54126 RepID=A0A454Y635_PRIPA|nr:hypothetical protein PRIPAC_82245 [Pristionchus pacificus]|eukprot:PDM80015.1 hypothetical protein PRIPAC_32594 [Pristionchus pacificus]